METFEYLIGHGADALTWWQMTIRAAVVFVFGLLLIRAFGAGRRPTAAWR